MTVTEFLSRLNFRPHGAVANSWDAFSPSGAVLMQLWQAPGQRVRDHAIECVESGAKGYAVLSAPPGNTHGPGVWAKHANLECVYPVLAIEREPNGDVFVVLGEPVVAETIAE